MCLYVCACTCECVRESVCVCAKGKDVKRWWEEVLKIKRTEALRETLRNYMITAAPPTPRRGRERLSAGKRRATHSKVSLESLGAPVGEVAADLAGVADVQTMQLVQPVRDGLKQQDMGWSHSVKQWDMGWIHSAKQWDMGWSHSVNGIEPQC